LSSFILKPPKFIKKIKTRIKKAPYERAGLMATSKNSPTDSKSWNLLVQDDTDKKYYRELEGTAYCRCDNITPQKFTHRLIQRYLSYSEDIAILG